MSQAFRQRPNIHTQWRLRNPELPRPTTWMEILLDIVYAVVIVRIGNFWGEEITVANSLQYMVLVTIVWWAWHCSVWYLNRVIGDDDWQRLLLFLQIVLVFFMGISMASAFSTGSTYFVLCYVGIRLTLIALYRRVWQSVAGLRLLWHRFLSGFSLTAGIWLLSLLFPAPIRFYVWIIAMATDFAVVLVPLSRRQQGMLPPDKPHLGKKYRLMMILIPGLSLLNVLEAIPRYVLGISFALSTLFALGIAVAMVWLYSDSLNRPLKENDRRVEAAPHLWVFAHLPLVMGVGGFAVAIKLMLISIPGQPELPGYRWLLVVSVSVFLLALAIIEYSGRLSRRDALNLRWLLIRSGSIIFILIQAFVGPTLTPIYILFAVLGILVLQIILTVPESDDQELPGMTAPVDEKLEARNSD